VKGEGKEGQGPWGSSGSNLGAKESTSAATEHADIEAWAIIEAMEPDAAMLNNQPKSLAYAELYNSGVTRHMFPYKELFINYHSIDPWPITAADKHILYAIGTGNLKIQVLNAGKFTTVILCDALHAPKMGLTVISINHITKAGHKVLFDGTVCKIKNSKGVTISKIPVGDNGLYKVEHASMAAGAMTKTVKHSELHKWLGHISINTIHSLIKSNVIQGIKLTDDLNEFTCDSCEYGKAMRKVIQKEWVAPLASSFGNEIHMDVWGPSLSNSLGGHLYYVTFTDDATWYSKIQVICMKDKAFGAYNDFVAWAKTQHGVQIKWLCSD
jgi:Pol polyprotein, beta-barrel domain/GAG-pre-integrase domain